MLSLPSPFDTTTRVTASVATPTSPTSRVSVAGPARLTLTYIGLGANNFWIDEKLVIPNPLKNAISLVPAAFLPTSEARSVEPAPAGATLTTFAGSTEASRATRVIVVRVAGFTCIASRDVISTEGAAELLPETKNALNTTPARMLAMPKATTVVFFDKIGGMPINPFSSTVVMPTVHVHRPGVVVVATDLVTRLEEDVVLVIGNR